VPVGIIYEPEMGEIPLDPKLKKALLDTDSTSVLNGLSVDLLKQVATSAALPPHLQRHLALATWVRAVLLENTEVGKALASMLATLMPELKAHFNAYRLANTQEARKFAAVFLLLKLPGARPYLREGFHQLTPPNHVDNYRDNGWPGGGVALNSIDFLNETQKAAVMKEVGQLPALDRSFDQVIMWAKKHPDDP
jgi:hypothetical protein